MANFFCRSRPTTNWAVSTAYALGDRRKATAAALGIHFEVTTAGTSGGSEPTWNTTVGGTTTDNTVTWTTRGSAADWVASTAYVVGDRVVATTAASAARQNYCFECTTAGTSGGSEPAWSVTIGGTQADNTVVWTVRACTTWNNAHIRLEKFTSQTVAVGDTIFVGDEHFQTQASTLTLNTANYSSRTNPCKIICVNDTGDPSSPTTLATTAVLETTGASGINWSQAGTAYVYGFTFNVGTGASAASLTLGNNIYEACALKILNTAATSSINADLGTAGAMSIKLINTTMQFSAAGQGVALGDGEFEWRDTQNALVLGTVPTVLFETYTDSSNIVRLHGIDLANLNTAIVNLASQLTVNIDLFNCKLHASVALTTGTHPGTAGGFIRMINCDSGATNTNTQYETGEGSLTDELTIVRTGGASDGTTAFAWKIVTRATTPRFEFPFISLPIAQWNNTTGASKTLTVEIVNDGLTLTDREVWVEIEYLGTSGFPISSFIDDAAADLLATAANQASSSVAWTTTGLGSPVKQKLEVTFTPQLKGPVIARVCVARPSLTLYVDPIATIT